MQKFLLGIDTVDVIIDYLSKAKKYIRLAIFQMHDPRLFDILMMKLKEGVKIEICTLPYDSINREVIDDVKTRFEELENYGATIQFIRWNVGDPSRTTMTEGRWYSFHGKFIVTDIVAIALSANFTMENEIDAAIIINDQDIIDDFNQKFDQLLSKFVTLADDTHGTLKSEIINGIADKNDLRKILSLPDGIQAERHSQFWIRHYPTTLINDRYREKLGLILCPFDGTARSIYEYVIDTAEGDIYISTESFTDVEFSTFLKHRARENGNTIKLLTGSRSQDFNDRINSMYLELVASGVDIKTLNEPLHAKILITDEYLIVGSVNLNKINLGFSPSGLYWRSNTETVFISDDSKLIHQAKEKFNFIFDSGIDICTEFARRNQKNIGNQFKSYKLSSQTEAKRILSLFIIHEKVNMNKAIIRVGKFIHLLVRIIHPTRQMVLKEDVIAALILYFLSETKQTLAQLDERICSYAQIPDIHNAITKLLDNELIELADGSYKINLEKLLS